MIPDLVESAMILGGQFESSRRGVIQITFPSGLSTYKYSHFLRYMDKVLLPCVHECLRGNLRGDVCVRKALLLYSHLLLFYPAG